MNKNKNDLSEWITERGCLSGTDFRKKDSFLGMKVEGMCISEEKFEPQPDEFLMQGCQGQVVNCAIADDEFLDYEIIGHAKEHNAEELKNGIEVQIFAEKPPDVPRQHIPDLNWEQFARGPSREKNIDFLLRCIKQRVSLVCAGSKRLFVFNGRYYENISELKKAASYYKKVLGEQTNRLFRDYSEIHNQLLSDPDISIDSIDHLPINRDVIVFQNGTYDVKMEKFYKNQFWPDDYAFSILATDYDETDESGRDIINSFLNTFCDHNEERIRLFCEILGFCISGYENKKSFFYFLGKPDAGKSTVCRFIEQVIGENLYMACSIHELNGKYATGELFGIKVCADEDVAVDRALKTDDISLIKKISSSDKIRTRQIYQSAVQMRPDCKLVWAGNGMVKFDTKEDLQPLINRMVVFPLDVSIPKEERDTEILSKLIIGRNYMLTLALKALHNLVQNRFIFSEVVDAEKYFNSSIYLYGVEDFVQENCVIDADAVAYTQVLYGQYQDFCKENPEYKRLSKNQFIPYLREKYGVERYSDGSRRGIRGIRLKDGLAEIND